MLHGGFPCEVQTLRGTQIHDVNINSKNGSMWSMQIYIPCLFLTQLYRGSAALLICEWKLEVSRTHCKLHCERLICISIKLIF